MTGYRLCRIRTAKHPYYIAAASLNIRTAEELCYFVWQYPALSYEDLRVPAFTRWIAGELGLPDTALSMEKAEKAGGGCGAFLLPFLRAAGYLSDAEIRACTAGFTRFATRTMADQLCRRADELFSLRRYEKAMETYQEAAAAAGNYENILKERVWHNFGAAAMQMLEYEKACAAFRRAYELKNSPENLETLLLALRISKPDEKYQKATAELGAGQEILDRVEAKAAGAYPREVKIPGNIDEYLERERRAYHIWAGT